MRIVAVIAAVCIAVPWMAAGAAEPAIDGIPGPLRWQNAPERWNVEGGSKLSITAGKRTDWFISPVDGDRRDNSPRLVFQPADDFVLSTRVTVDFSSQWNAGVLVVYALDDMWAKLCFERTIEGQPSIVTVATRKYSDDDTHFPIRSGSVYLKVAKAGQVVVFYASEDGRKWSIVRVFTFGPDVKVQAGFSSQSPIGDRATAVFEEIHYSARRVNIWTGE